MALKWIMPRFWLTGRNCKALTDCAGLQVNQISGGDYFLMGKYSGMYFLMYIKQLSLKKRPKRLGTSVEHPVGMKVEGPILIICINMHYSDYCSRSRTANKVSSRRHWTHQPGQCSEMREAEIQQHLEGPTLATPAVAVLAYVYRVLLKDSVKNLI